MTEKKKKPVIFPRLRIIDGGKQIPPPEKRRHYPGYNPRTGLIEIRPGVYTPPSRAAVLLWWRVLDD
ncbi:hypothetical protein D6827_02820 [Candidatus Parcubacteria bacterium]|nr:MAG: hypothetical protein D6827_02820 [Candidatus Parcubacteria bacterium]